MCFCYNENMLRIIWYGHSCFKFVCDSFSMVIDPYDGVDGLQMPEIQANFCFCSHEHRDHNATHYVNLIPSENFANIETIVVPHDHHGGAHRGLNKIHIFSMGGYKIAHLGDIGCVPENDVLDKLKGFDIVLAPINGFYTINPQELKEICDIIKPRLVIPMHYFRKDNNSGYPDGNMIDIFKKLFDYKEVNESSLNIDENIFVKPALILTKSEGDK